MGQVDSLGSLLLNRAERDPDRVVFSFLRDGREIEAALPLGSLVERAASLAREIADRTNPGDRVMLSYDNVLEFICSLFGCFFSNTIPVPVVPARRADQRDLLKGIRSACAPSLLLSESPNQPLLEPFAGMHCILTDQLQAGPAQSSRLVPRIATGVAYIQYTSGSTTAPRGAVVTHANALANLRYIDQGFGHGTDSVIVSWLPHFHDMGLVYGILQPIYNAIPCYLMKPRAFAQRPLSWLDAISKFSGTHSGAPNFAYQACVARAEREGLGNLRLDSWRVAFNGAEPVRSDTLQAFSETFRIAGFDSNSFIPSYGLAECTLKVCSGSLAGATILSFDRGSLERGTAVLAERKSSSSELVGCGLPQPPHKLRVVNPHTLECLPDSQVGEILVSGPSVTEGYWNNVQATAETFGTALRGDDASYLRTGDTGFVFRRDLFITGRRKDLILVRGRNVYPLDIETTVQSAVQWDGCETAAVQDETTGEILLIQEVRRHQGVDLYLLASEIWARLADRHELLPDRIIFTKRGTIPRTSSGKISRSKLLARIREGAVGAIEQFQGPVSGGAPASDVGNGPSIEHLRVVVSHTLGRTISIEECAKPLIEIGLDSLKASQLEVALERQFGASVPSWSLLKHTVATLCEGVAEKVETRDGAITHSQASPSHPRASPEQSRLWRVAKANNDSALNVSLGIRFRGAFDLKRVRDAVSSMWSRHDQLRTTFTESSGELIPLRLPDGLLPLAVKNREQGDAATTSRDEASIPFKVGLEPLFRCTVCRLADQDHLVVLTAHHLIVDGWSLRLMADEFLLLYSDPQSLAGQPPPPPYGKWAASEWERIDSAEGRADLAFWQELIQAPATLSGLTSISGRLPLCGPCRTRRSTLPEQLSKAVVAYSSCHGFTPFMVFAAGVALLLRRRQEDDHAIFPFTTANRTATTQNTIGFFAKPTIMSIHVDSNCTLNHMLCMVRESLLDIYRHSATPFETQMSLFCVGPRKNSLPFLFSYLPAYVGTRVINRQTTAEIFQIDRTQLDCDVFLTINEDDPGFSLALDYRTDRCTSHDAQILLDQLQFLIGRLVGAPEETVESCLAEQRVHSKTFVISAQFTAEPLLPVLDFWLDKLEIPLQPMLVPYDQLLEQMLNPASEVRSSDSSVSCLLLRLGAIRERGGISGLTSFCSDLVEAIRRHDNSNGTKLLIVVCPTEGGREELLIAESLIYEQLSGLGLITTISHEEVLRAYPVPDIFDPYTKDLAAIPYTQAFYAAVGTMIARRLLMLRNGPPKAIIVDCDDTLWRGVCGEDGPNGVRFHEGNMALQSRLKGLREVGVLLCLCSNNLREDVQEVFRCRKDEMTIGWDDFVLHEINWNPKLANIQGIADTLGFDAASLILIDNDVFECRKVTGSIPQISVFCPPAEPAAMKAYVEHCWALDAKAVSLEDRNRAQFYDDEKRRNGQIAGVANLNEIGRELGLEVTISDIVASDVPRVSQLTYRTSQFTTSCERYSEIRLRTLSADPACFALSVHARDRYGDYGLVGSVIGRDDADRRMLVECFALSCRALGRGIEYSVASFLGARALSLGQVSIEFEVRNGPRNLPAIQFLRSIGDLSQNGDVFSCRSSPERLVASDHLLHVPLDPGKSKSESSLVPAFEDRRAMIAAVLDEIAKSLNNVSTIQSAIRSRHSSSACLERSLDLESAVSEIWRGVLGESAQGSFIECGGDSIQAVSLLTAIRDKCGVELPWSALFECDSTVPGIASAIRRARESGQKGIVD